MDENMVETETEIPETEEESQLLESEELQTETPEINTEELETAINDQTAAGEQRAKLLQLPFARVKHIIKTDSEVNLVNQEAVFLITKAAELFIDSLAQEAYRYTAQSKKKTIQKNDVYNAVDNIDALVFLEGMLKQ